MLLSEVFNLASLSRGGLEVLFTRFAVGSARRMRRCTDTWHPDYASAPHSNRLIFTSSQTSPGCSPSLADTEMPNPSLVQQSD